MASLNRYERALHAYLGRHGIPYCPVKETKRAIWDDEPLKNFDLVAYPAGDRQLLIDVKGRRTTAKRPYLENWVTQDDLESLDRWQSLFGPGAAGLFVFAYELSSGVREAFIDRQSFAERRYGYLGIGVDDYRRHARRRSPRWRTLSLPRALFRECARPLSCWLTVDPAEPRRGDAVLADDSVQVSFKGTV
ncbi:hypothetical protein Pan216_13720 [Planctomycetes bacterium Pan216]|uniref:Uncharacterized protein n=1 Tax=Kolteria novifilia TaxID=2527975 RepID=A0A518B0N4_9BACT|nr:hypothetical protein Pan216_13720 [Planctomycetes bacterium Pan216]